MRPKIEIDPALGGLESSSIASLLPGLGLEPAVAGEQVPTLSLADLLEVLSEEIATRYSSHAVVWNLVALLVAGVFLIASCWLLRVLSGKKPTRQLHAEPTKHLHAQLRSANTERERKIKELREKEREREKERARAMSDDNKAPKGEPKGDKGPKNPKSSPASQDIHVLTRKGNLAGLRRLLERGTHPDARSKESQKTPLHIACQYGQLSAAKMLIESFNADIEARTALGRTPLHLAAAQGFEEVVNYLMSRNANTKAVTPEGSSALELSRKYSYARVETMLTPRT